jgi:acetyl-CoA C-acetyltransferase
MNQTGLTEEDLSRIVIKNYGNAIKNPLLQSTNVPTREEILSSPHMLYPLRSWDMPREADGAVILIIASEEFIRANGLDAVWIRGMGLCSDHYYLGSRNLRRLESFTRAMNEACGQAGVKPGEIEFLELSEAFSFYEPMIVESSEILNGSSIREWIEDGAGSLNSKVVVNPSGGSVAANPVPATGLLKVYECYRQLKGEGNLKGKRLGLAHGSSGICHQINCIAIMGV